MTECEGLDDCQISHSHLQLHYKPYIDYTRHDRA